MTFIMRIWQFNIVLKSFAILSRGDENIHTDLLSGLQCGLVRIFLYPRDKGILQRLNCHSLEVPECNSAQNPVFQKGTR